MRTIPLTQGKVALVDDEDYDSLAAHKWYARKDHRTWYAQRATGPVGARVILNMHRVILGAPPGMKVDHRDHDGLNNTRANLREATGSQNCANQRPQVRAGKASPFKGVQRYRSKFRATITVGGKAFFLGAYQTDVEAARVYDRAAVEHFGEFAFTNFPQEKSA